ncbi:MAG TPA: zincin-like metallopeptidase toxin domain-containing protein [Flavobacterium sp.]|jgi:hypothetical protein
MTTDIFEDFDEESRDLLNGLKMIDFDALQQRMNHDFLSLINKGSDEKGNPFDDSNSGNRWREEWKTRTMPEIRDYFFPEAKVRAKNNITICDTTAIFDGTEIEQNNIPLEEVVIETYGVGRAPLDLGDMAIYFFTSADGAKLIRARRCAYESRFKNPNVLAVFMETDEGGNTFGSVMEFVIGENVKRLFKGDYWKKIFTFLERNELRVSREDTEDLIKKALSHQHFLEYAARLFNDLAGRLSFTVFDAISKGFGLIAEGIGSWKFKDEEWDTAHENFSPANAPFIFFELPHNRLMEMRYKNSQMLKQITSGFKNIVETHREQIPDVILKPMQSFIAMLQEKTKLFFLAFEEKGSVFMKLIEQNNENVNAFLCGFINGFLDFIKCIFDLFAFIFQFVKATVDFALNKSYYLNLVLEYIENGIDALSKFDVLGFFKKMVTLPIEFLLNFNSFLLNLKLPSVNLSKIAYFSGYVLLGILQIVLEIIFTGGSISIERLFAKSAQIINGFIKKAGSFADDVFRALDKLISLIKKGADHLASFIRQVLDDFFEWLKGLFKSGKADEVFDNVIGKGLYSGKILSKLEIEDWARMLFKKFGTKLKKVDSFSSRNILAQFDPSTNTILYKDDVTEYFIAHEHFHAEEMHKIGFDNYVKDAPLKGIEELDYTNENLIRRYKREKYVYDKLKTNANKYNLNSQERWHVEAYFYEIEQSLIEKSIKIPKK